MQGTIPAEWGRSGSFPKLKEAGLNGNAYLGGPLPAAWGAQPGSMGDLELLVAQDCQLWGGLPVSWAAQLPALGGLDVSNNELSGEAVLPHREDLLQVRAHQPHGRCLWDACNSELKGALPV